jgi:Protein of unknown function (DUF3429)
MSDHPTPSYANTQPDQAQPGELARQLGHAGLIPFVGGALFVWLLTGRIDHEPFFFLVSAITGYAALIISFLGGMPWGLAMRDAAQPDETVRKALWGGIAYALLAWVGLCMPPHAGLVWLGALLIGCYLNDRKLYPALGVAHWLQLRFRLTMVASLSCFLTAAQI